MASTSQQTDTTPVTTTITKVEESDDVVMKDASSGHQLPEWLEEAKGLVYLEEVDGFIDPDAIKIEPPKCGIDDKVVSVYQCIKCGNKQSNRDDIHRMKCTRCFNKAFNKIRPTKWVKFRAY